MNEAQLPELIVPVGIPAAGKSTLTAAYRERGYAVLSSDVIRGELLGDLPYPDTQEERKTLNQQVFSHMRQRAAALLREGRSVVMDATNLNRKKRMGLLKALQQIPHIATCILLITSVAVCMARNAKREGPARVPDEEMHKMLTAFEVPCYAEGWHSIRPAADATPYRFPFEQAERLDQENPHHRLTLGAHMRAAAAHLAAQGAPAYLQRVARYHDTGKLYTKRFCNVHGEPTAAAHYYGHENYSAYLYLTEMCCGTPVTEEEFDAILYETALINYHMRPLRVWRESAAAKAADEALFGEAFIADLTALHAADQAAH